MARVSFKIIRLQLNGYTLAAEQGFAEAQHNLAYMYKNGEGVLQDYQTAAKWYTLAAEQGDPNAQYNLALMYDIGEGVLQDYQTAVKWYTLAAEQGIAQAQNNLGVLYAQGNGVLQDYTYAHMWFNIAAANGNDNSSQSREIVQDSMTPAQIEKAQALARECVKKEYKDC